MSPGDARSARELRRLEPRHHRADGRASSAIVELRFFSSVSTRRGSPNSTFEGLRASVTPSVNRMRSSPGLSCTQEAAAGRSANRPSGSPVVASLRGSPEAGRRTGALCPQLQYSRVPLRKSAQHKKRWRTMMQHCRDLVWHSPELSWRQHLVLHELPCVRPSPPPP